jgi:hypothetical protein
MIIILKKTFFAALLTLPCLLAILVIQNVEISPREIIYDGNPSILWLNLGLILGGLYLLILFLALGDIFGFRSENFKSHFSIIEGWLISLFSGASLLTLFGTALGLLGLLKPLLLTSFICLGSFVFFYRNPKFISHLIHWFFASNLAKVSLRLRGLTALIRILTLILLFLLMSSQLWKLETDVQQFYRGYFEQVQLTSSSIIDSTIRDGIGFLVGRGHGVTLYFIGMTHVDGMAIVSYLYAFLTSMMIRQIAVRLLNILPDTTIPKIYINSIVPDILLLITLWVATTSAPNGNLTVNPGRLHLETGAFMMFFIWIIFLASYIDSTVRSSFLFRTLLVPVMALPIMLVTSTFVVAMTLGIGFILVLILKDFHGAIHLVGLGIIALFSMTISLMINQLNAGIGEVNPYQLFIPFINEQKLNHWTSLEFLIYINNSQGISFAPESNLDGLIALSKGFTERALQISIEAIIPIIAGKINPYFAYVFIGFVLWLTIRMGQILNRLSKQSYTAWLVLVSYISLTSLLCAFSTHTSLHRLLGFQIGFGVIVVSLPMIIFSLIPVRSQINHTYFAILFCVSLILFWFFSWHVAILYVAISIFKPAWRSLAMVIGVMYILLTFPIDSIEIRALMFFWLLASLYSLFFGIELPPGNLSRFIKLKSPISFVLILFLSIILGFSNIQNPPNRPLYAGVFPQGKKMPDSYSEQKRVGNYLQSLEVFLGRKGISHLAPYLNDLQCEKYSEIIPGDNPILPLNGGATIIPFCYNSPLLKPGKIIETLHPPFAPDFGLLMLSTNEQAIEIYRKWNVNYFLIEKGEIHYWAAGVSELFNGTNLRKYFDTFYEDKDVFIFTWRGKGKYPVNKEEADKIDLWRNDVISSDSFQGLIFLRKWDNERKGILK